MTIQVELKEKHIDVNMHSWQMWTPWLNVLSWPVSPTTQGVDWDTYLHTVTWQTYKKASGSWTLDWWDLTWPTGADSTVPWPAGIDWQTVLNWTIDPTTEWIDWDFYINTTSNDIFWPKTAGVWGVWTSLIWPETQFEYSINWTTLWHAAFVVWDFYIRSSTDWWITWSSWMKFIWTDWVGAWDMLKATYDPNVVNGDAFDMDNMVEWTTTKILTDTERANIITNNAKISYPWDQTTITGNAGTATTLQTARTINTVSFNWSADIIVPSDIAPSTSWNVLTSNWTVWQSVAPAGGSIMWNSHTRNYAATTNYLSLIDGISNATENAVQAYITEDFTIKNLYFNIHNNWATTWVFTVVIRKNWVDTALTLSVWIGATGDFSDLVNSVAFVKWDLISLRVTSTFDVTVYWYRFWVYCI